MSNDSASHLRSCCMSTLSRDLKLSDAHFQKHLLSACCYCACRIVYTCDMTVEFTIITLQNSHIMQLLDHVGIHPCQMLSTMTECGIQIEPVRHFLRCGGSWDGPAVHWYHLWLQPEMLVC
jgi:hypothetical protein